MSAYWSATCAGRETSFLALAATQYRFAVSVLTSGEHVGEYTANFEERDSPVR